jgi:hypothetical protein
MCEGLGESWDAQIAASAVRIDDPGDVVVSWLE